MKYTIDEKIKSHKSSRNYALLVGFILTISSIWLPTFYKEHDFYLYANFGLNITGIEYYIEYFVMNYGILLILSWLVNKSFFSRSYLHFNIATNILWILITLNMINLTIFSPNFMMSFLLTLIIILITKWNVDFYKYSKTEEYISKKIQNNFIFSIIPYISLCIWLVLFFAMIFYPVSRQV